MERVGTLHIVRLSGDPVYSVTFADNEVSGGVMDLKKFNDVHELASFLSKDIKVHADVVTSALAGLRDEGNASIFDVILTDEQLSALGLSITKKQQVEVSGETYIVEWKRGKFVISKRRGTPDTEDAILVLRAIREGKGKDIK